MIQQLFQNRINPSKIKFILLFLLSFFSGFTYANDCNDIEITSTDTTIKIIGLTAPKEIIKVYNAEWQRIFECSADCPDSIIIHDITQGIYHIDLQLFDENWSNICKDIIDINVTNCICTEEYAPVCGVDGKTYGNACEAECAGVEIAAEGECEPCICPAIYMPVCGVDGQTYGNACEAACAGVDVVSEGECAPVITTCDLLARIQLNPDLCEQCLTEIAIYTLKEKNFLVSLADNKICADGLTTVLDCESGEEYCLEGGIAGFSCGDFFEEAIKIETILKEDCTPCVCTEEYAPVCGVDGKTYSNACEAACAGVDVAFKGECAPVITTCDLLARIQLNPDLCEQCLTEVAVYTLEGKRYLVSLADSILCADGITTVLDCDTGDAFCTKGGILGATCGDFFAKAIKTEIILKDDCTPCICTREYEPVCGVNGRTYNNACEAECAGVEIASKGECEPCVCPANYDPVCGADGKTYSNACEAACAGVEVVSKRACEISCVCPEIYAPVCGEDGKTYDNECFAACVGVKILFEGNCDTCIGEPNPLIKCNNDSIPVCGCDGKTYMNPCQAEQMGIKSWAEGACPPKNECDLLNRIDLNPDLCGQCLSEIALYSYQGNNYIVMFGGNESCEDGATTILGCNGGETFCVEGTLLDSDCGNFFEEAVKIQTIIAAPECLDDCHGLPTPGVPCEEIYAPVCGCNGKTYDNECVAQSIGLKSWTPGACEQTSITCGEITLNINGETLEIAGLPNNRYHFKVHDKNDNWREIYECSFDCGSKQVIELTQGNYYVKVYNDKWESICEQDINIKDQEAENEPSTTSGEFNCGDALLTFSNGQVKLVGQEDKKYHLKIIDGQYRDVFACMWNCGSTIIADNIPNGRYTVKVMDSEYQTLCEQSVLILNSNATATIHNNQLIKVDAYPNPASNEIYISTQKIKAPSFTLQVLNTYGQIMETKSIKQAESVIQIDLSTYQNGLYFYQIQIPNNPVISGKFLVSKLH